MLSWPWYSLVISLCVSLYVIYTLRTRSGGPRLCKSRRDLHLMIYHVWQDITWVRSYSSLKRRLAPWHLPVNWLARHHKLRCRFSALSLQLTLAMACTCMAYTELNSKTKYISTIYAQSLSQDAVSLLHDFLTVGALSSRWTKETAITSFQKD